MKIKGYELALSEEKLDDIIEHKTQLKSMKKKAFLSSLNDIQNII